MTGVLEAAALLLLVAGLMKVRDPGPARAALARARVDLPDALTSALAARSGGLVQAAVGVLIIVMGGRIAAALVLVSFAVLAVASWRMAVVAPGTSCGCFGEVDSPAHGWHVGANVALAVAGAVAMLWPQPGVVALAAERPVLAVPLVLLSLTLAYATFLLMTALPSMLRQSEATA